MSRKTKPIRKQSKKKKSPEGLRAWWGGLEDTTRHAISRTALRAFLLVLLVSAVAVSFVLMESHVVFRDKPVYDPVRVQLTNAPNWMPETLKRQIAKSLAAAGQDYRDNDLTAKVYTRAAANPWVRQLQSVMKFRDERGRAIVAVTGKYRSPMAVVRRGYKSIGRRNANACYVDCEGVRLPAASQIPKWVMRAYSPRGGAPEKVYFVNRSDVPRGMRVRPVHYIEIILGDNEPDMPAVGKRWVSESLRDSLRLTKIIRSRQYARQFDRIDARNYGGRHNRNMEHLSLWAGDTQIKFGRFPHADGVDWVVSPEVKMENLDRYVSMRNGRLRGAPGIDLRIDAYEHSRIR